MRYNTYFTVGVNILWCCCCYNFVIWGKD